MDERDERIAKNETVFRAANREIEHAGQEAGGTGQLIEVLCECGRQECDGVITMTVADYDGVHSQADRFAVLRGHESPEIEKVVEERACYLVGSTSLARLRTSSRRSPARAAVVPWSFRSQCQGIVNCRRPKEPALEAGVTLGPGLQ